jgi:hypothetical protein
LRGDPDFGGDPLGGDFYSLLSNNNLGCVKIAFETLNNFDA